MGQFSQDLTLFLHHFLLLMVTFNYNFESQHYQDRTSVNEIVYFIMKKQLSALYLSKLPDYEKLGVLSNE